VIFTAYFDEADTHGPDPTVIVGCFWGHAYQWERFEKKLSRLQRTYGFNIFHAKEFKAGSGEFRQWSPEKRYQLSRELSDLVGNTLAEGVTIALDREKYLKEYRALADQKMHIDSQLGVCFRAILIHVVRQVHRIGKRPTLHAVVEDGHTNAADTVRIFQAIKLRLERRGTFVLGDISIESKKEAPRLMVADFLAAAYSMIRAQSIPLPEADNDYVNKPIYGHRRGMNAIGFQVGGLDDFRQQAQAERNERKASRNEDTKASRRTR
jgi:hypothetical protein